MQTSWTARCGVDINLDAVMAARNRLNFSYTPVDADYVAPEIGRMPEMRAHLTLSKARPLTSSQPILPKPASFPIPMTAKVIYLACITSLNSRMK